MRKCVQRLKMLESCELWTFDFGQRASPDASRGSDKPTGTGPVWICPLAPFALHSNIYHWGESYLDQTS